jgi:hypothetical protein
MNVLEAFNRAVADLFKAPCYHRLQALVTGQYGWFRAQFRSSIWMIPSAVFGPYAPSGLIQQETSLKKHCHAGGTHFLQCIQPHAKNGPDLSLKASSSRRFGVNPGHWLRSEAGLNNELSIGD